MRDLLKVFFYYYDINTGVDFLFKCFTFLISIRFTSLCVYRHILFVNVYMFVFEFEGERSGRTVHVHIFV